MFRAIFAFFIVGLDKSVFRGDQREDATSTDVGVFSVVLIVRMVLEVLSITISYFYQT